MKKQIICDLERRKIFSKNEIKNLSIKILLRSKKISYLENTKNYSQNDYHFCKIKNRCFLTLRARSIIRLAKLSRIKFKEFCSYGLVLGVKLYNW